MILPEDTILENRYRIDRLLGQGGMGAIYRGFDTRLKRPVAIKENFFQTPEAIQQFEREALMLANLNHPNLPRVIDHFSFEGQQYLVMDYIEGQDLWEMVKGQNHPLNEAQALDYIIQVCGAVQYLHSRKPPIIHRDIKPQNIKITPEGQAVLVDFGIAKMAEGGQRTSTGARGVTPGFSPLEQYGGSGTSPVSDVYSLGATLYAVLTGQKPPDSASRMVNQATFLPPVELNTELSQQVSQAIEHAMQPQPDDRPQAVAAWRQALEAIRPATESPPSDDDALTIMTSAKNLSQNRAKAVAGATPPVVGQRARGLARLFRLGSMLKPDKSSTDKKIVATSPRKPMVAVLLSLILFGGSGQIYLGQVKKGAALIALSIFWLLAGASFCFPAVIFTPIFGAIDAYLITNKLNNGEAVSSWEFGSSVWMARIFTITIIGTILTLFLGVIAIITGAG